MYNYTSAALLLIEHGADVSLTNDEGRTPLECLSSPEDVHICTKAALWGSKRSAARLLTSCGYSMWEYYGGLLVNNIARPPGMLHYRTGGAGSAAGGASVGASAGKPGVRPLGGLNMEDLKPGPFSEASSPLPTPSKQPPAHSHFGLPSRGGGGARPGESQGSGRVPGEFAPGEEDEEEEGYNEYNDTASAINMQTMQDDVDQSVNQMDMLNSSYEHLDL